MAQPAATSLGPPLKWAGGKRWQLPFLRPLWAPHAHRRLVEPFCGGLAVVLGLAPVRALLNDRNPHLINFYRWLRKGLVIDVPMKNDRALFAAHRDRFNELLRRRGHRSREAASLFYFLNRTGYNGLCRFNRSGLFNVPFGRYDRIRYETDLTRYRPILAPWDFTSGDMERIDLDGEDFVYADPPYDVQFTSYAQHAFTWNDQVRVAELLSVHRGPVVLVNQATKRIEELYRGLKYDVDFLDAPRRINSTGDRRPAREIMAVRNL